MHIARISVLPAHRRKGIAKTLIRVSTVVHFLLHANCTMTIHINQHTSVLVLQAAFKAAVAERKVSEASLYVSVENTPAINLYKGCGFQVCDLVIAIEWWLPDVCLTLI